MHFSLQAKTKSLFAVFCLSLMSCSAVAQTAFETAVERAFSGQQGAVAVVRVSDGHLLASHNRLTLTRRVATPGSAIKPFVLQLMLERGVVRQEERIGCRRNLVIQGKRLNCVHPAELESFIARDALAYSCNSYFVTAAARLLPGELERRYAELGFSRPSGLLAGEGEGRITKARTLADRQLLGIGAAGIQVTPLELASAYLQLARVDSRKMPAAQSAVVQGLRDAVDYGLAHNAHTPRISSAGKTGTASDHGTAQTHAWFAGFAPTDKPEIVVVVFVERGHGSLEAASIARKVFEAYAEQRR